MKLQLLKWLCAFCLLLDGLIGVLTIGFIRTSVALWSAKIVARYRYKNNNNK